MDDKLTIDDSEYNHLLEKKAIESEYQKENAILFQKVQLMEQQLNDFKERENSWRGSYKSLLHMINKNSGSEINAPIILDIYNKGHTQSEFCGQSNFDEKDFSEINSNYLNNLEGNDLRKRLEEQITKSMANKSDDCRDIFEPKNENELNEKKSAKLAWLNSNINNIIENNKKNIENMHPKDIKDSQMFKKSQTNKNRDNNENWEEITKFKNKHSNNKDIRSEYQREVQTFRITNQNTQSATKTAEYAESERQYNLRNSTNPKDNRNQKIISPLMTKLHSDINKSGDNTIDQLTAMELNCDSVCNMHKDETPSPRLAKTTAHKSDMKESKKNIQKKLVYNSKCHSSNGSSPNKKSPNSQNQTENPLESTPKCDNSLSCNRRLFKSGHNNSIEPETNNSLIEGEGQTLQNKDYIDNNTPLEDDSIKKQRLKHNYDKISKLQFQIQPFHTKTESDFKLYSKNSRTHTTTHKASSFQVSMNTQQKSNKVSSSKKNRVEDKVNSKKENSGVFKANIQISDLIRSNNIEISKNVYPATTQNKKVTQNREVKKQSINNEFASVNHINSTAGKSKKRLRSNKSETLFLQNQASFTQHLSSKKLKIEDPKNIISSQKYINNSSGKKGFVKQMYHRPQKSNIISDSQNKKDSSHSHTLSCYNSCLQDKAQNLLSSNEKMLLSKEKIQDTSEFNTVSTHNMTKKLPTNFGSVSNISQNLMKTYRQNFVLKIFRQRRLVSNISKDKKKSDKKQNTQPQKNNFIEKQTNNSTDSSQFIEQELKINNNQGHSDSKPKKSKDLKNFYKTNFYDKSGNCIGRGSVGNERNLNQQKKLFRQKDSLLQRNSAKDFDRNNKTENPKEEKNRLRRKQANSKDFNSENTDCKDNIDTNQTYSHNSYNKKLKNNLLGPNLNSSTWIFQTSNNLTSLNKTKESRYKSSATLFTKNMKCLMSNSKIKNRGSDLHTSSFIQKMTAIGESHKDKNEKRKPCVSNTQINTKKLIPTKKDKRSSYNILTKNLLTCPTMQNLHKKNTSIMGLKNNQSDLNSNGANNSKRKFIHDDYTSDIDQYHSFNNNYGYQEEEEQNTEGSLCNRKISILPEDMYNQDRIKEREDSSDILNGAEDHTNFVTNSILPTTMRSVDAIQDYQNDMYQEFEENLAYNSGNYHSSNRDYANNRVKCPIKTNSNKNGIKNNQFSDYLSIRLNNNSNQPKSKTPNRNIPYGNCSNSKNNNNYNSCNHGCCSGHHNSSSNMINGNSGFININLNANYNQNSTIKIDQENPKKVEIQIMNGNSASPNCNFHNQTPDNMERFSYKQGFCSQFEPQVPRNKNMDLSRRCSNKNLIDMPGNFYFKPNINDNSMNTNTSGPYTDNISDNLYQTEYRHSVKPTTDASSRYQTHNTKILTENSSLVQNYTSNPIHTNNRLETTSNLPININEDWIDLNLNNKFTKTDNNLGRKSYKGVRIIDKDHRQNFKSSKDQDNHNENSFFQTPNTNENFNFKGRNHTVNEVTYRNENNLNPKNSNSRKNIQIGSTSPNGKKARQLKIFSRSNLQNGGFSLSGYYSSSQQDLKEFDDAANQTASFNKNNELKNKFADKIHTNASPLETESNLPNSRVSSNFNINQIKILDSNFNSDMKNLNQIGNNSINEEQEGVIQNESDKSKYESNGSSKLSVLNKIGPYNNNPMSSDDLDNRNSFFHSSNDKIVIYDSQEKYSEKNNGRGNDNLCSVNNFDCHSTGPEPGITKYSPLKKENIEPINKITMDGYKSNSSLLMKLSSKQNENAFKKKDFNRPDKNPNQQSFDKSKGDIKHYPNNGENQPNFEDDSQERDNSDGVVNIELIQEKLNRRYRSIEGFLKSKI